ncbi:hypothetical protein Ct9H90mP29_22740 [bacterium]|nr:MAG: hypothetical protein Ct9H90mP29_22740 [bacterium]
MYWSNWDGMTDIASAIQIQKGLGATNLVAGQLGGTINIVSGAATAEDHSVTNRSLVVILF